MIEQMLTSAELADLLGVSPHTLLDWAQRGEIPSFKLNGRAVRFRVSEVEVWLEEQRRERVTS